MTTAEQLAWAEGYAAGATERDNLFRAAVDDAYARGHAHGRVEGFAAGQKQALEIEGPRLIGEGYRRAVREYQAGQLVIPDAYLTNALTERRTA